MNERPEIIISGVSGRFSNCANVNQLKDKLYKGVDMTYDNEERWPKGKNDNHYYSQVNCD